MGAFPPTIVLFTNGPENFDDTYVRYLTKYLRDSFPFSEVAIKVVLRAKSEGGGKPTSITLSEDTLAESAAIPDEVPVVRAPSRPEKTRKSRAAKAAPAAAVPVVKPRKKKPVESET